MEPTPTGSMMQRKLILKNLMIYFVGSYHEKNSVHNYCRCYALLGMQW